MKLIISIVPDSDAGRLTDTLVANKFGVTRINTAGGFLKKGNATLLIGVEDAKANRVFEIIGEMAPSAVTFSVNVVRYEKF